MSTDEIEQALEIIVDSISRSSLDNYTKLELLINLKLFFEDYNKNIRLLNSKKHDLRRF